MESIDIRDVLRLELMNHINTIGLPEVLKILSGGVREVGSRYFDDWETSMCEVAKALEVLANRVGEFEEHYGWREP